MSFKHVLRHPNTLNWSFTLLALGLVMALFIANDILKMFGIILAFSSLVFTIFATYEIQSLFWRSQYEWWDDNDGQFEAWQEGKL